jgi:hypothetical protein
MLKPQLAQPLKQRVQLPRVSVYVLRQI